MGEEKKKEDREKELKKATAGMLRSAKTIYVLLSPCTKMPYVLCDARTYDDEVLLFFEEEDAKEAVKTLARDRQPAQAVKIEKRGLPAFYIGLLPMGVNCILVNWKKNTEVSIQLHEIVRRQEVEGKTLVENPELHLTALYFMQETRRTQTPKLTEEMRELHEEMLVHYQEGRYILPTREDGGIVVVKQKDGKIFQPVFTDAQEFQKFIMMNQGYTLKPMVLTAEKIPAVLPEGSVGVAINPYGVNLQMRIDRTRQK